MLALTLSLALLMLAPPTELQAQVRDPWREDAMAITASPPATVAAIALSIRSRAIQDSRCYLLNGGAVESFFVSEDLPVGSVIGTLSVNGDPDEERGDITLRVQEKGAAVSIAPGTKNVTLVRALDREERSGPSNVYVNVRCDRRLTADPSFVIPVSVRVWDVNDNAPVWAGAPYRARVSELAAPGARLQARGAGGGAPRAADADLPGPHATLRYRVLPAPHSEFVAFANELDSVLIVNKPLDYETLPNFTVTLRAEDAGSPPLHNDTTLYVEVLDADDQNPRFSHEHYSAVVTEHTQKDSVLTTTPGPIAAADQDVGINAPLHYSATGDGAGLVRVDRDSGAVAATDRLLARLPVTIVLKAVQVDNPDRYALATLSVSRARAAGVRFARRQYAAAVSEAAAPGAVLAALRTEPAGDPANPLQYYVSERGFLDKFAINSAGEVVLRRNLDYEEQDNYYYQVMVTDGHSNDTASINITVLNVNEWEPRFRYPQYEFRVDVPEGEEGGEGGSGLLPVGKLDVFDGDKADTVTLSLKGSDAGMLQLSPAGELYVVSARVTSHNSSAVRAVVTARDSGDPPRQSSVPVTVHVSERLRRAPGGGGAGVPLVATFGGAGALLAVLLCALLLYIHRRRSKSSPGPGSAPYTAHEKLPARPPSRGPAAPAPAPAPPPLPAGSGSLQSVSAGASTILANSSSSLDLRDTLPAHGTHTNGSAGRQSGRAGRSKVAPQPPAPAAPPPPAAPVSLMSDHLCAGAGRSGVAWPSSTIPARVKKLSWDDATELHKDSAEEVHEATNTTVQDHMNLTVYF